MLASLPRELAEHLDACIVIQKQRALVADDDPVYERRIFARFRREQTIEVLLILRHENACVHQAHDIRYFLRRAGRIDAARDGADAGGCEIHQKILDGHIAHDCDAGAGLEPAGKKPRRNAPDLLAVDLPRQLAEDAASLEANSNRVRLLCHALRKELGDRELPQARKRRLQLRRRRTCQVHACDPVGGKRIKIHAVFLSASSTRDTRSRGTRA